jgi:hypothetical protein
LSRTAAPASILVGLSQDLSHSNTAQHGLTTPQHHNFINVGLKIHNAVDDATLPGLGNMSELKFFLAQGSPPSPTPIPYALTQFQAQCRAHRRRQHPINNAKMRERAQTRQSKCQKTDVLALKIRRHQALELLFWLPNENFTQKISISRSTAVVLVIAPRLS